MAMGYMDVLLVVEVLCIDWLFGWIKWIYDYYLGCAFGCHQFEYYLVTVVNIVLIFVFTIFYMQLVTSIYYILVARYGNLQNSKSIKCKKKKIEKKIDGEMEIER